ncbi:unnamed protein product [Cuscuta epithymum]|uniref:Secreted protein n=1 Tax=Cuscuta epithymum TaxID=186058 RepID=A0AAV0F0G5_9ASTE|nr:unnamed protein product [Cuscuta epithymum]
MRSSIASLLHGSVNSVVLTIAITPLHGQRCDGLSMPSLSFLSFLAQVPSTLKRKKRRSERWPSVTTDLEARLGVVETARVNTVNEAGGAGGRSHGVEDS